MKGRGERDICLDDGSRSKTQGPLRCTELAEKRGWRCEFAIQLDTLTLVPDARLLIAGTQHVTGRTGPAAAYARDFLNVRRSPSNRGGYSLPACAAAPMPPFFAGDCARVDCLGALDGAVRSGIRAARLLAKTMTTRGKQASPE